MEGVRPGRPDRAPEYDRNSAAPFWRRMFCTLPRWHPGGSKCPGGVRPPGGRRELPASMCVAAERAGVRLPPGYLRP